MEGKTSANHSKSYLNGKKGANTLLLLPKSTFEGDNRFLSPKEYEMRERAKICRFRRICCFFQLNQTFD
jgi:hypothetical protein